MDSRIKWDKEGRKGGGEKGLMLKVKDEKHNKDGDGNDKEDPNNSNNRRSRG